MPHPDGILLREPGHEQRGLARSNIYGPEEIWLQNAKGPVEEGLLLEVGPHVRAVPLADALVATPLEKKQKKIRHLEISSASACESPHLQQDNCVLWEVLALLECLDQPLPVEGEEGHGHGVGVRAHGVESVPRVGGHPGLGGGGHGGGGGDAAMNGEEVCMFSKAPASSTKE